MDSFLFGFITLLSFSVALGMQNTHVINVGLKRANWFIVALVCFLCDAVLINMGVWGIGEFIANNKLFKLMITLSGILFILLYSVNLFREAYIGTGILEVGSSIKVKSIIITSFAVSLLNPHVYIDTLILIPGISASLTDNLQTIYFLLGCLVASFSWFLGLGFFASYMAPIFRKRSYWRVFNFLNASFMIYIAWVISKNIDSSVLNNIL